jgi:tetratricopeptide (TPR) repeat protein
MSQLSHHLGDYAAGQEHGQRALSIARQLGHRHLEGEALTYLGHCLVGAGSLAEAIDAYQEALDTRRQLAEHSLAMETLAGLARVSLAQNDLARAQTHVEEILSFLEDNTLDCAEEPFWAYLTCYRVLHANQDARAQVLLTTAHSLLQDLAAKIDDEALRRSFLENVAAHREIVREFGSPSPS